MFHLQWPIVEILGSDKIYVSDFENESKQFSFIHEESIQLTSRNPFKMESPVLPLFSG